MNEDEREQLHAWWLSRMIHSYSFDYEYLYSSICIPDPIPGLDNDCTSMPELEDDPIPGLDDDCTSMPELEDDPIPGLDDEETSTGVD